MNDCVVIIVFLNFIFFFLSNSVQLGKVFYLKRNKNGGKGSKSAAFVVFFSVSQDDVTTEATGKMHESPLTV